jgi:hypothetical protein
MTHSHLPNPLMQGVPMFEYHGWAVVRDGTGDNANLRRIVGELQRVSGEFNNGSGVSDIRWINGECLVSFAGLPNHRHECVFDWFHWLAKHAPGSYGLLYVWDDESETFGNSFRVSCLRRGEVVQGADTFLSPCIPTIESPDEPD